MDIISIIRLLGGIGLFLFGMSLMSSYLTKLAGGSLERILQMLTTGKKKGVGYVKGWGLGAGVTAIIQSSAATTIMLIGFVNAGIMALPQAIPVVMGSNVGSTVTAQILRLGDLGSGSRQSQPAWPPGIRPRIVRPRRISRGRDCISPHWPGGNGRLFWYRRHWRGRGPRRSDGSCSLPPQSPFW